MLIIIIRHSPRAINPDRKMVWQLELPSRPSLLVAMFRNNTQQNNKADTPSVLISKLCLSHSLGCKHPHSSTLLWDSNQPVSLLLDTMLSETYRKRGCLWIRLSISLLDFRCFSLQLNLLFLNPHSFLWQSSRPPLSSSLSVTPPPTFSSTYLKIPFLHRFSPSPPFLWDFFLSFLWESILFNSCHTERFCSLSRGSGETLRGKGLSVRERERKNLKSVQGSRLKVTRSPHLPSRSSRLTLNRSRIWSFYKMKRR